MAEMAEQDEQGITIALSAVQLAAVLEGETVDGQQATLGNRIIGALRLLGCAGEVAGATTLALAPEPTMLTKAGAVGLAAHAADMCSTGGRQLWTGRDERTLTERGTSLLAQQLGAGPRLAGNVGMATEVIVPFAASLLAGAIRVGAVRMGEIVLMRHEAEAGSRLGGHTLLKHVDKDEAFLRQRIAETASWKRPPTAMSYFTNVRVAEHQISRAFRRNRGQIAKWSRTAAPGNIMRPEIIFDAGKVVGYGVVRATDQLVPMSRMRIVLRKGPYNRRPHFILTAYPIP